MRIPALEVLIVSVVAVPAFGSVVAPDLKSAFFFGLLGGTVSNTGTSLVIGNVGATTTLTGFPPGTATGTVYGAPSDPTVTSAYTDFESALALALNNGTTPSTQTPLGLTTSQTFVGNNVFQFLSTDVVSTTGIVLTFDAQNNANDVFILRATRDLTINGTLTFALINGAKASNIYWIVGRSATISPSGVPETFDGNILSADTFTMSANTGGSGVLAGLVNGCVFATNANTLAGQSIISGCSASGAASAVPEPGSAAMAALGGLLGVVGLWKFRPVRPA